MSSGPLALFEFKLARSLKTENSDVQSDWLVSWGSSTVFRLIKLHGKSQKLSLVRGKFGLLGWQGHRSGRYLASPTF